MRLHLSWWTAISCALALAAPSAAVADADPAFLQAQKAAAAYFHRPPACKKMNVQDVDQAPGLWAYTFYGACTIYAAPILHEQSYQFRCLVYTHELGHTMYWGHIGDPDGPTNAQDPRHIMNSALTPGMRFNLCQPERLKVHDGRTRTYFRGSDRDWCMQNPNDCMDSYSRLYSSVVGNKDIFVS